MNIDDLQYVEQATKLLKEASRRLVAIEDGWIDTVRVKHHDPDFSNPVCYTVSEGLPETSKKLILLIVKEHMLADIHSLKSDLRDHGVSL